MLERKAAGNTAQAKTVAKRKFAVLHDSWDRRADQLQCAADAGDIKKVHQLFREICGPTWRKAICLPMPGGGTELLQKTPWNPSRYISRPSLTKTEMLTWI